MPSDAERSDRAQAERVEGLLASVQDAVATLQKLGSDLEREVARALYRDPATNTSALATLELENARLKQAVEGRAVIEQAKGVIIARQGGSEQEAFSTLTRIARREKVSMRDAAAAIVEAGARSGLQRSGTPATGVPRPGKTVDDDPKAETAGGTDPQGLAIPDITAPDITAPGMTAPNIVAPRPVSLGVMPPAATRAAVLGDEAEEFRIPALLAAMPALPMRAAAPSSEPLPVASLASSPVALPEQAGPGSGEIVQLNQLLTPADPTTGNPARRRWRSSSPSHVSKRNAPRFRSSAF